MFVLYIPLQKITLPAHGGYTGVVQYTPCRHALRAKTPRRQIHSRIHTNSKEIMMSNYRKNVATLLATTALAFAMPVFTLPAVAGHGMDSTDCSMGGKMAEKMGKRMERKLDKLHDALKLTAAQEPAWKTFTEKMAPSDTMRQQMQSTAANWSTLTAPERMQKMMDAMMSRQTEMKSHVQAVTDFYATLTPEQKKAMDANFMAGRGMGKDADHD
jgi:periplasmic protein CpxP/Spy